MIIHINGMSGVGKLTVAKVLATNLAARLVDNHSIIDLVTACCDRGSSEYFLMIDRLLNVVFEQISRSPNETYIFTNALTAEFVEDRKRLDDIAEFAEMNNITFVQVLLMCDIEENKKRIVEEERRLKGKLINPDRLVEAYENYTIYHPLALHALEIDTTKLSSEKTAAVIKDYVAAVKNGSTKVLRP
jgi:cytidylate kinase